MTTPLFGVTELPLQSLIHLPFLGPPSSSELMVLDGEAGKQNTKFNLLVDMRFKKTLPQYN